MGFCGLSPYLWTHTLNSQSLVCHFEARRYPHKYLPSQLRTKNCGLKNKDHLINLLGCEDGPTNITKPRIYNFDFSSVVEQSVRSLMQNCCFDVFNVNKSKAFEHGEDDHTQLKLACFLLRTRTRRVLNIVSHENSTPSGNDLHYRKQTRSILSVLRCN